MGKVLETLGGVSREDMLLVQEPTRVAFLAAFDRLSKLVAASRVNGVRREVVVYYSGHSDEEGLLIARTASATTSCVREFRPCPPTFAWPSLTRAHREPSRGTRAACAAPLRAGRLGQHQRPCLPLVQIRTATRKRDGARPAAPERPSPVPNQWRTCCVPLLVNSAWAAP